MIKPNARVSEFNAENGSIPISVLVAEVCALARNAEHSQLVEAIVILNNFDNEILQTPAHEIEARTTSTGQNCDLQAGVNHNVLAILLKAHSDSEVIRNGWLADAENDKKSSLLINPALDEKITRVSDILLDLSHLVSLVSSDSWMNLVAKSKLLIQNLDDNSTGVIDRLALSVCRDIQKIKFF